MPHWTDDNHNGLLFNKSDQYVYMSEFTLLDVTNEIDCSFTISFWLKLISSFQLQPGIIFERSSVKYLLYLE